MNDVFISYSSYDYLIAGILHDRLSAAGFSVWWDQRITPGEPYKDEIMAELSNAKVARRAIQLRKYVPLKYRCENVPEDYRTLQYIEITKWNADPKHPDFQKIVTGINGIIASRAQRQNLHQLSVSVTDKNRQANVKKLRAFQTFRDHGGPTLVVIPAGRFFMGSAEGADAEKDAHKCEHPQHLVDVAKPFAIGKFPVTVGEWLAATRAEAGLKYVPPYEEAHDNVPVTCVNWERCERLCGLAVQPYRPAVSPSIRGRMGILLPRRHHRAIRNY